MYIYDSIGRVDVCSYSPCQAAKQPTVLKPRCQAVKLLSRTCCKATPLSSQAVKQSNCNCCTSKLSSCQADTVARPGCPAAKLSTCCLLTLSSFSCHTAPKLQHTQQSGSNSRPRPIQTRIQTEPDHNQLRVSPC